jgi:hypothetical protein
MDGCAQHQYPRKNWSSFMVFNLEHPAVQALTRELVNSAHPSFLHRFLWADDEEIGSLDKGWNYLEGWYAPQYEKLRAVHYTRGGPWFEHMRNCGFADEWLSERVKLALTSAFRDMQLCRDVIAECDVMHRN